MNELRWVTCGIFYCRDSAEINGVARFKLHRGLTVTCSEVGNKNIPLSVMGKFKKRHSGQTREPPKMRFDTF